MTTATRLPLDSALRDELLRAVEARADDLVELACDLIRIDSTNPNYRSARPDAAGGESRANERLAQSCAALGLEVHWVAPDPGRRNLVAVRRGRGRGRSLLLNSHIDTVAGDARHWTKTTPWKPVLRDGVLYGLGAVDMKGAAAAGWAALAALTDAELDLSGDVQLHSVVGEEAMEHELGTSACLRAGFVADAAINTEATSSDLQRFTLATASARLSFRPDHRRGP